MIESIVRIRIELQETEPTIWLRVDVPLSSTLLALHDFIQFAFRWTDSHLFEFELGDRRYGQPEYDRYADERLYKAASTGNCLHARINGPDDSWIVWTAAEPVDDAGWFSQRVETMARILPHVRQVRAGSTRARQCRDAGHDHRGPA